MYIYIYIHIYIYIYIGPSARPSRRCFGEPPSLWRSIYHDCDCVCHRRPSGTHQLGTCFEEPLRRFGTFLVAFLLDCLSEMSVL